MASRPPCLAPAWLDILPSGEALGTRPPSLLLLNKCDLLTEEEQAELLEACAEAGLPPACLLSCKTGEGFSAFLALLEEQLAHM